MIGNALRFNLAGLPGMESFATNWDRISPNRQRTEISTVRHVCFYLKQGMSKRALDVPGTTTPIRLVWL